MASYQNLDLDALKKVNPDSYLNFGKLDMEEQPKEHLHHVRLAAHLGGWDPHEVLPFKAIKAQAQKLLGSSELLDIKKLQNGETLNPAVRLAYGISLKGLESEMVTRARSWMQAAALAA